MVAIASLFVVLAALPSIWAAPIHRHPRAVAHKRACAAKTTTTSSEVPTTTVHSTTTTHHATTTETVKTSTATSSKSTPSTDSKISGNALAKVWPVSVTDAKATWSTSSLVSNSVALTNDALNIYAGGKGSFTKAPDGSLGLHSFYSKGAYAPGHSPAGLSTGIDIYALTPIDLSKGNEVMFTYSAYFQSGFKFNKGGKLPGMFGGTSTAIGKQCSGGHHADGKCWSSRMMFRTDGAGELYAYFPAFGNNDKQIKAVSVGKNIMNDVYGDSVGRGSFKWPTGEWTSVSQRIKLNKVGSQDGEFEIFINGKSLFTVDGLEFRKDASSLVRGIQLESFFGGHDASWASPQDQSTWFKDFSVAILS